MAKQAPPMEDVEAPFVPASVSMAEVTLKAVLLGMLLSVVLGAANTYLGLKVGLTVAAAIPAAVVSLGVLKLFRNHTVLENNMVQTIASAGTAVASGILFTIPAMLILKTSTGQPVWDHVHYLETTIIGLVGGILGVLFTVPLRKALIVEERLAFPEGVATAEVLKAGESGGSGLGALMLGGGLGALYKFLQSGLNLFSESSLYVQEFGRRVYAGVGTALSPALLGVGFIIGIRVATLVFAGGVLGWMIGLPLVTSLLSPEHIAADIADSDPCNANIFGAVMGAAKCAFKFEVRYLGVGAMLVGGVWSLIKLRKPLTRAVKQGIQSARGGKVETQPVRTEVELSPVVTYSGIALMLVPMFFFYAFVTEWNWGVAAVMALIMAVTGFLFSAVGAYMAGLVGSSNNPISGVTILTLLVSAFTLKALGLMPDVGAAATIFVAAIIAVAGSIASDNLQDLKAGHMLGATPRKQQAMIAIGAAVSAFFIAPIIQILVDGSEGGIAGLQAPQANLMASISGGIFNPDIAGLPYPIIGVGMLIAVALIVADLILQKVGSTFRIPVMAVAVGIYLGIEATAPIFLGGLLAWIAGKLFFRKTQKVMPEGNNPGVLFASGLIAGEAIIGIVIAALVGTDVTLRSPPKGLALLDWPGLLLLAYLGFVMVYMVMRPTRKQA